MTQVARAARADDVPGRRRPGRRAVLGVLGLGPLAAVAGCSRARGSVLAAPATSAPATAPTTAPAASSPVTARTSTAAGTDDGAPSAHRPVHLDIPVIGVSTDLVDLGIEPDGTLQVPSDPSRAGWLTTSAAPGDTGPSVIAGHLDSVRGAAVFVGLARLRPGDSVRVRRADGREVGFTVDGVQTWAKTRFPTEVVYGPAPGPVLRLVTCGGPYLHGRGGYQDNTVVFAS